MSTDEKTPQTETTTVSQAEQNGSANGSHDVQVPAQQSVADRAAEDKKAAAEEKRAAAEEKKAERAAKRKDRADAAKASAEALRERAAQVVRVVTLVIAFILAIAALLVALRHSINLQNPLVQTMTDLARFFDGPFNLQHGVFSFDGKHALIKDALLNWGLAALVYLMVGRFLAKVLTP